MGGFFTVLNRPTGNSACVLLRPFFFCVLVHWHWSLVENKNKITIRGFALLLLLLLPRPVSDFVCAAIKESL
jgi:hypothetical protein